MLAALDQLRANASFVFEFTHENIFQKIKEHKGNLQKQGITIPKATPKDLEGVDSILLSGM